MDGGLALVAAAVLMPAVARAQYQAPPPGPGFNYIFDGTPTGSDASFDKWVFASGTAAQSASQGQATLDTAAGAFLVNGSPFGSYWYPVRPLGDVVIRLQYTVQDTPTSTRNGGVMVRTPDPRYTGATTNDVLAQKPTGYSYELCPGATGVLRADDARGLGDVHLAGRRRAVPARAVGVLGCVLRAQRQSQCDQPGGNRRAGDQQQRE